MADRCMKSVQRPSMHRSYCMRRYRSIRSVTIHFHARIATAFKMYQGQCLHEQTQSQQSAWEIQQEDSKGQVQQCKHRSAKSQYGKVVSIQKNGMLVYMPKR